MSRSARPIKWMVVPAVLAIAAFALPVSSDDRRAQEPVPLLPGLWETDLTAGRERARKEGKPLLVVFRCLP